MNGLANTTLIGNLTKDIELRNTPSGAAVVSFTVAVNRPFKDKDGNWQEKTSFIDCVAWQGLAERLSKYAKKGQTVAVAGDLEQRSWEAKDGSKRSTTEVVARNVEILTREDRPLTQTEVVAESYKDVIPDAVPDKIDLSEIPF